MIGVVVGVVVGSSSGSSSGSRGVRIRIKKHLGATEPMGSYARARTNTHTHTQKHKHEPANCKHSEHKPSLACTRTHASKHTHTHTNVFLSNALVTNLRCHHARDAATPRARQAQEPGGGLETDDHRPRWGWKGTHT